MFVFVVPSGHDITSHSLESIPWWWYPPAPHLCLMDFLMFWIVDEKLHIAENIDGGLDDEKYPAAIQPGLDSNTVKTVIIRNSNHLINARCEERHIMIIIIRYVVQPGIGDESCMYPSPGVVLNFILNPVVSPHHVTYSTVVHHAGWDLVVHQLSKQLPSQQEGRSGWHASTIKPACSH